VTVPAATPTVTIGVTGKTTVGVVSEYFHEELVACQKYRY
jgi:hypothetical protein